MMFGASCGRRLRSSREDRLPRRREAADLGRVHADEQLQVGPRGEVLARLHQPLEHVREGVGRIVQLRVPRHVGEQADHRLRRDRGRCCAAISCGSWLRRRGGRRSSRTCPRGGCARYCISSRSCVADSSRCSQCSRGSRQQRVVVGVVVAEDEAPLAVRDVPGRDAHAFAARDLADDAPRHVDAVREDRRREADVRAAAGGWRWRSAAPIRDSAAARPRPAARRRATRSRRSAARRRARARRWPGRRDVKPWIVAERQRRGNARAPRARVVGSQPVARSDGS